MESISLQGGVESVDDGANVHAHGRGSDAIGRGSPNAVLLWL